MTGAARQPEADVPAPGEAEEPAAEPDGANQAAELAAARAEAAERTADLKRITAEYANYRKRVDRDRAAVVEGATGTVLASLLPVLDDIERARAHGDLTGTFKAVADQLEAGLEKLGLQPFGAVGDAFDPMLHEAVAHQGSAEVNVPTCMVVLRRGFRHGDRLLRPALVTVSDPAEDAPPAVEPVAPTDLPAGEPAEPASGGAGAQSDAVWTPPASAPGGSASASAPGEPETDEDDESPVAWFGELGEQQQD
ncbi:MAG: molecular chaperone GrpE [Mycobacteriales bacterium]